ncbi:uncharacterized protein KY384_003460 [Bacidia gigantensis]|uniref:uncharacterized protein n=1 Tax=Bacidia gigantensis TaxID=2732470 RepID=UPI001D04425F|nr:uncharacterized protein KY384_003460 [Bacidia gigantensis]KAG8531824.1 hypothetical protein KY384_003460 [Bacidia gigantensis]
MLDIQLRPFKDQIFDPWCRYIPASITPLYITVLAFACGLLSCLFTTQQQIILSLSFWILNRALDCVDGALARHRKAASDLGGFLDLLGDFIVYSLVPIAVAEGWDTSRHTLRAVTLLEASFHINNFILFYVAAVSEKGAKDTRNSKSRELTSVMMKPALIEGTESGVLFTLMLALPGHIGMLSYVMAALVTVGILQRTFEIVRTLG